jgi:hypothetical protein
MPGEVNAGADRRLHEATVTVGITDLVLHLGHRADNGDRIGLPFFDRETWPP